MKNRALPNQVLIIVALVLSTAPAGAGYLLSADPAAVEATGDASWLGSYAGRELYRTSDPVGTLGELPVDLTEVYLAVAPEPGLSPERGVVHARLDQRAVVCSLEPVELAELARRGWRLRALRPLLRAPAQPTIQPRPGAYDDYVDLVEVDTLDGFVYELTEFATRYTYSAPVKDARDYLVDRLEGWGCSVEVESWLGEPAVSLDVDGQAVILGTRMSYAFYSTDGGATFSTYLPPEGNLDAPVDCAAFAPGTFHYAAGSAYHRSGDGGATWTDLDLSGLFEEGEVARTLTFADEERGYLAGSAGTVLTTTDGGASWSAVTPVDASIYDSRAAADDPDLVVLVGAYETILRSTDGGASWSEIDTDGSATLQGVDFNADGVGVAVGLGRILRTDDGGASWSAVTAPGVGPGTGLNDVVFHGTGKVSILGDLGTLYHSLDDGLNWERRELSTAGSLKCAAYDGGALWLAGQDGPLLSTDGGSTFSDLHGRLDDGCEVVWQNVIAERPGSVDPEWLVYLTAHYDSISTDSDPYVLAPGANDNGSGVAALLEAARVTAGVETERTLRWGLFTGEELGLRGSSYHVNNVVRAGDPVAGVLNVDMVVWSDPADEQEDLDLIHDEASTWLAGLLQRACDDYGAGMPGTLFIDQEFYRSDHAPFWIVGYQALLAIEDKHVPYPYYHTSRDDYETIQGCFGLTRQVTRAVVAAALSLAGGTGGWLGDLETAYAYPNPYRPTEHDHLRFVGLRPGCEVTLYDLSGAEVYTATATGTWLDWDGANTGGREVAPGVYLYVLRAPAGDVVRGKLTLIR
ncbi:MAG: M28 family peptidase [Candidatus Coatesbacteria bacterium]|nr:M28 family peptidase [Candidatus Coatesbacteria bacterium]